MDFYFRFSKAHDFNLFILGQISLILWSYLRKPIDFHQIHKNPIQMQDVSLFIYTVM